MLEFGEGREPASDVELVLHRPQILSVGTVRVRDFGYEVNDWSFCVNGRTPSFTLWELCRIEYLIERGELEQGPNGLRFARSRIHRDLAEVAAWAGIDKDEALRPARERAVEVRMGSALSQERRQARELRLRASKSPHGKLVHLTRQADKLDAQARKAALIARRRLVPQLLAIMRSLAEPAS